MSEIREARVKKLLGLSTEAVNPRSLSDKDSLISQGISASSLNQIERNFPTQVKYLLNVQNMLVYFLTD